jgi:hypothetical protein
MEIKETYYFSPNDFNVKGRHRMNDKTFREVVKEFERDFHKRHPSHFGIYLFANKNTMLLLQYSCDADANLIYGMDLIDGEFDPATNWKIENHSQYTTVYAIDSAYSFEAYSDNEFKDGAYPLTLLIDDRLSNGTLLLKYLDDDEADDEVNPVGVDVEILMT